MFLSSTDGCDVANVQLLTTEQRRM